MPCFYVGRTLLSVILSRGRAPSPHFRSSIFDPRKLQPAPLQPILRACTPFPYSFPPAFTPLHPRFSPGFCPHSSLAQTSITAPASTYAPPQIFFLPRPFPAIRATRVPRASCPCSPSQHGRASPMSALIRAHPCPIRGKRNPICANLHHLRHLRPLFNPYWNNFGPSSFRYCLQLIHVCPPPLVWNWWLMLFL